MSERLRTKPISVQLNEGEAPKEIQVLRTGNFNHPFYGPFSITQEFLEQMISNFELNVRGVDLMIDYNHECEEAAGWVKALNLKNGGNELWAEIDWTDQGRGDLISKKYRYVSADFDEKYMDAETNHNYGPTLFGAALTNRPFVKNMAPAVELTESQTGDIMNLEELKADNKKLSDQVTELTDKVRKLTEGKENLSDVEKENKSLKDEIKDLTTKVDELTKEKELSEKKADFQKLLSEGKAVKAQEEAFLAGDTVKFAELSGSINTDAKGSGEAPKDTKESPEDEVIRLAEEMVKDGKAKNLAEAQSRVLNENHELRKKLYA